MAVSSPKSNLKKSRRSICGVLGVLRTFAFVGLMVGMAGFVMNIVYLYTQVISDDAINSSTTRKDHPLFVLTGFLDRGRSRHDRIARGWRSSSGSINEANKEEDGKLLTQNYVLDRMRQLTSESWKHCGEAGSSNNLRSSVQTKQNQLFGFLRALESFQKSQNVQETNTNSTSVALQNEERACLLPNVATLACHVQQYAMAVTFQGNQHFRTLFMNLLSWLTYSSISEIIVVIPNQDWETNDRNAQFDNKYKRRLTAWHDNPDHKVTLILQPRAMQEDGVSASSQVTVLLLKSIETRSTSEAILFMDGTQLWTGNEEGLRAGFELWKRNPDALVVSHKETGEWRTQQGRPQPKESELQLRIQQHKFACDSSSRSDPVGLFQPLCEEQDPDNQFTIYNLFRDLVDMTGVFVHRSYLCLLKHEAVKPLLSITKTTGPQNDDATDGHTLIEMRATLAAGLAQLTGTPALLFPAWIYPPRNETKAYHWGWHPRQALRAAKRFEHKSQDDHDKVALQQQVLSTSLGYFGIKPTNDNAMKPFWCSSESMMGESFYLADLPWMDRAGDEYWKCAKSVKLLPGS